MDKYIFSDEEINKILLSSPMALPNNPSGYGLKGSNIKSFFYDYIRKLMHLINEHFILIENDKDTSISSHNEDVLAHNDIRKMISDLKFNIESAMEYSKGAYQLASEKSKIIPVKDVSEMITKLDGSLSIGDKFVLLEKDVPDFTLFEKGSENTEATSFTMMDLLMGNIAFEAGESYLYEGYLLVASESGIDTSNFAKQTDLTSFEDALNQLDLELNKAIDNLIDELTLKEDTVKIVDEDGETVILVNKTEHNLGLRTSAILQLPEGVPSEFECIVNFRSGSTATAFSAPSDIIFTQDDCWQGVFTPYKNRIYEISIKNVDGILIARVGSCDYE